MTTTVRVAASHGVPVEVDGVDPRDGTVLQTWSVEPGAEVTVYAHAGQNIVVRELGPQDIPLAQTAAGE